MKYLSKRMPLDLTHIHVVQCGKGRPIILIHGLTNNWEGHIPLATVLAKKYTVFIPDMPGYGDSGTLAGYDVETMALYLKKLVVALTLRSVVVAGLSMGGLIAGHFAKTYPHLTDKAIILGPVLPDVRRKADIMKYIMQSADALPAGRRILKRIVDTRAHAYLTAKYLNMYSFNKELIDTYGLRGKHKMTRDAYVEMGISVADYDLAKTLREVRVPTLLLYGRQDRMSKPLFAKEHVLPTNPFLSISIVPDAGHVVSFEKPKETARAISTFLQGHAKSSRQGRAI